MIADDLTKPTGSPLVLDVLKNGGCRLEHEKAWARIKRAPELDSRYFLAAFVKHQLTDTQRGQHLMTKLSIAPLPPKTRAPGKPKAATPAKKNARW